MIKKKSKKPRYWLNAVKHLQSNDPVLSKLIKNNGRILVRPSGTESKIRIMVESNDKKILRKCINIVKRSIIN